MGNLNRGLQKLRLGRLPRHVDTYEEQGLGHLPRHVDSYGELDQGLQKTEIRKSALPRGLIFLPCPWSQSNFLFTVTCGMTLTPAVWPLALSQGPILPEQCLNSAATPNHAGGMCHHYLIGTGNEIL